MTLSRVGWGVLAVVLAVAGGVAAALSPRVAAAAIALLVVWWLLRLAGIGLPELIVATMPFMFFPPVGVLLNVAVSDLFFPLMLLSVITSAKPELSKSARNMMGTITSLALAFFIYLVLSIVVSTLLRPDTRADLAALDLMKMLVVLLYLVVLTYIFLSIDQERRYRLLRLWVVVAVAQAVLSLLGWLPSDGWRSEGFFQDPNLYGGYLLVSAVLLIYLVVSRGFRYWLVWLALLAGGVLATGSRGAMLAAAVLVVGVVFLLGHTKMGIVVAAMCSIVGYLLVASPERLVSWGVPGVERLTASASAAGSDPRWSLWERAFDLWREHPFLGVGFGQFTRFSEGLTPFRGQGVGQVAHNSFLSYLAETGIVGLIAFTTLLIVPAVQVLRSSVLSGREKSALLLGLIVIASMMMTLNLQNLRYVWAFLGVALALSADPLGGTKDPHRDVPQQAGLPR